MSLEPLIEDIGEIDLSNINWIIVGGESGPKARPMNPERVHRIKKQCDQKNILFFFEQWGGWGGDGKKHTKRQTEDYFLEKRGIICRHLRRIFFMG